jgi:hypothetical protein
VPISIAPFDVELRQKRPAHKYEGKKQRRETTRPCSTIDLSRALLWGSVSFSRLKTFYNAANPTSVTEISPIEKNAASIMALVICLFPVKK